MKECDLCNHCEMCMWRKELNEEGCEFYSEGNIRWIPVKWHEITAEERQREEYPEDWVYLLDCPMPNDEQEILVTVRSKKGNYVEKDVCYLDDSYYFDSGYDWLEDIVAWCELPEPYKAEGEGKE